MRTKNNLLALAGRYATDRRVPVATVMKEILHYEILFALNQSGASARLTFQGGTSLRLCYQGTRYSEDLDFVGGADFDPADMAPFAELLQREVGQAYGLQVDILAPKNKESAEGAEDGIAVARWRARVHIPQADPSLPQRQVINIEVASVPAHRRDLLPVAANYDHLPAPHRQMLLVVEPLPEILADKLVALSARPFLKARDIWDLKFLTDKGVKLDDDVVDLVVAKLGDYRLDSSVIKQALEARAHILTSPETEVAFLMEMRRFVDATVAMQLEIPGVARQYLERAAALGRALLVAPAMQ
ncbi:nucleotidyl transferase AbiEii/AbiGii toxin family protein [Bordetella sp. LUAb4]|uniref:nucleotidyl transferase AbiEii/AbiGii toxin family protein n=1 Tax=Bordetella sp. LUAb4 TaxID=2843195 RepID=UPI001E3DE5F9|nr:nucleotidyl transferase AbiEii/AbiGii toxin family protein [Bordetella sp. LUAb4]